MIELPFFIYALTDELTLVDYAREHGSTLLPVETMKLRSRRKARSYAPYLPDYVYQNSFNYEEENAHSKTTKDFSSYLVNGLKALAEKYLHTVNDTLYVKKEYRNQGIGGILIDYILEEIKKLGYQEATIGVDKDNTPALHLYQKKGFTDILFDGKDEYGEFYKLMKEI